MQTWTQTALPKDITLEKTVKALAANGIMAEIVSSGEEAKGRVTALLPKGAVMSVSC